MSEAANLSLKAFGKQDTYLLSKDPEKTFFKYQNIKKHSEFRKFHKSKSVLNPGRAAGWPFNQTIKVEYDPKNMGDLLTNLYLKVDLPAKETANVNYTTPLGRGFLKRATMYVDDIKVEEITDDWEMIHESLYLDPQSRKGNLVLQNMSEPFTPGVSAPSSYEHANRFIIPLSFFFSRKYGKTEHRKEVEDRQYFPVCAVHKQRIMFELEFHPQTWWQGVEDSHPTTPTIELNNFQLISEEIKLSHEERLYLVESGHEILVNVLKKHSSFITTPNSDTTFKVNLEPKSKVKAFHWFFRDKLFTTQTLATYRYVTYVKSRAEKTVWSSGSSSTSMITRNTPIMKKARFFLNGESFPNTLMESHEHYKYAVPYKFDLGVTDDKINIYTQSFALHPLHEKSTGTLDFANLNSDRTLIEFEMTKLLPNLPTPIAPIGVCPAMTDPVVAQPTGANHYIVAAYTVTTPQTLTWVLYNLSDQYQVDNTVLQFGESPLTPCEPVAAMVGTSWWISIVGPGPVTLTNLGRRQSPILDVVGAPSSSDQTFSGEFELALYYLELQKFNFLRGFMTIEY